MKRVVLLLCVGWPGLIFGSPATEFLDNLKACTPYNYSAPHPDISNYMATNAIVGRRGDKCLVHFSLPNKMKMICAFGDDDVTNLTGDDQYDKTRRLNFFAGGSTESGRQLMQKKCRTQRQ